MGLAGASIFPQTAQAQVLSPAGSILQTMNLETGAKAGAMGGAFSAVADDPSAASIGTRQDWPGSNSRKSRRPTTNGFRTPFSRIWGAFCPRPGGGGGSGPGFPMSISGLLTTGIPSAICWAPKRPRLGPELPPRRPIGVTSGWGWPLRRTRKITPIITWVGWDWTPGALFRSGWASLSAGARTYRPSVRL